EAGYERWLQRTGKPHPFGRDITSLSGGRSLEQFRVLTPEEAARAAAALKEATTAAQDDRRAAERVEIVRRIFGLIHLAVQQFWAMERLRTQPVRSVAAAKQAVADARHLVALTDQMCDYITQTIEGPSARAYELFKRSRRDPIYVRMKAGEPAPELGFAITAGLSAAANYLREAIGPEAATAWWRGICDSERSPLLQAAFRSAQQRSAGVVAENLLDDPSFESLGRELAPSGDYVLDRTHRRRIGDVRCWFPERTPYRIVVTNEEARSGDYAVMFEHCHRLRLSRWVRARPGSRYRAGLWVKHNEGDGTYRIAVDAKRKDGSYCQLAAHTVPHRPDQWQHFVVEVTAPADATNLFLRLFVTNQTATSRCWLDDLFLGRCPAPSDPAQSE
ncbi:MAG: hypothetical protein GXP27_16385, partial [Planctomycetes bacterium]|nr:hypothetical protein [Planctomycetota bacterium]